MVFAFRVLHSPPASALFRGTVMSNNEFSLRPSERARLFSKYRLAAAFVPAVMLGFVALAAQTEPAAREIPNNFTHLSIKDGMSQGAALALLQDRRGFI